MKEKKPNGRGKNPNSLKNLRAIDNSDPKINEAKSNGQIERSKRNNIICTARTLFENADILPELVNGIKEEVKNGSYKNALDFFKAIKEPDAQDINLNGALEVQKVFVEEKTQKATDKHIDDFINGSNK